MSPNRMERLVEELAKFDDNELEAFMACVTLKKEENKREEIRKVFNDLVEAWQKLSNLGFDVVTDYWDENGNVETEVLILSEIYIAEQKEERAT